MQLIIFQRMNRVTKIDFICMVVVYMSYQIEEPYSTSAADICDINLMQCCCFLLLKLN